MTHDHLPDGYYWAEDHLAGERAIISVHDSHFMAFSRRQHNAFVGGKVKHIHDRYVILTTIKEPE